MSSAWWSDRARTTHFWMFKLSVFCIDCLHGLVKVLECKLFTVETEGLYKVSQDYYGIFKVLKCQMLTQVKGEARFCKSTMNICLMLRGSQIPLSAQKNLWPREVLLI